MNWWVTTHWPPREDDPENVAKRIKGSNLQSLHLLDAITASF